MATLDEILADTRAALPAARARRAELERRCALRPAPLPFAPALRGPRLALIAEVKRRSPSAGAIRPDLDPAERAAAYEREGAAAISVLTDTPHFGGSLDDLHAVAARVAVPVLRKDFILDEIQLLEARAAGAAAVLLIVRALPPARLATLLREAEALGLGALVEVHTVPELETALELGAPTIGVNSRDLDTFAVDTTTAWGLLARIPADRTAVAESGIHDLDGATRAAEAGADAVLIGTALSAADAPAPLVRAIASVPRRGR